MEQNKPFFKQVQDVMKVIVILNSTLRNNIIEILKLKDETPNNIALELRADSSTVAINLRALKEFGIVSCDKPGKGKYYSLNKERYRELEKAVEYFNKVI
jgi:predicted transcriptional regulator